MSFSVFPLCQCVYTRQAGRTPALQPNWQNSEKSQNFKKKNTIFNDHPVSEQLKTGKKENFQTFMTQEPKIVEKFGEPHR